MNAQQATPDNMLVTFTWLKEALPNLMSQQDWQSRANKYEVTLKLLRASIEEDERRQYAFELLNLFASEREVVEFLSRGLATVDSVRQRILVWLKVYLPDKVIDGQTVNDLCECILSPFTLTS